MNIKTAHLGDAQALYTTYRNSPDYFRMLGTAIPTASEVELELGLALMDRRRHVELIEHEGEIVGVLDWKEAYPEPQDVTVNLLLLNPAQRGAGLGSRVMWDLESRLSAGTSRLMASVLGENPAGARFWERLGYHFAIDARPVMTWYAKPLEESAARPALPGGRPARRAQALPQRVGQF
ncbi:GNAT family N-acetyltransferase [Deinococcus sp. Marseille-Q6407]|uniref:GNAT family N-acetyltransferase n=1 Tax=Deinococcus sp. Marseille-Q6407 TaxID=2969223 RepID=UPI0021BF59ED|nr:GNAT family N-acetyltransferase [Deinococcus sp. Marseille-Q6407]